MRNPETFFVRGAGTGASNGGGNNLLNLTGPKTGQHLKMECAICQEKFTKTSLVCQMPCHIKHIFHSECIKPWIKRQNACPLCKEAIPVSEDRLPSDQPEDYY